MVESTENDLLTVVTCNVRLSRANDGPNAWPLRREGLCALLQTLAPDVLCLQEPYIEQIEAVTAALPEHTLIGAGRIDGKLEGEWAAILVRRSRLTVEDSGTFWLSSTPDVPGSRGWDAAYHPRICTWAKLCDVVTGRRFGVYNSHWDNEGTEARLNSAGMIAARLRGDSTIPGIVTGDFNCTPRSLPVRYLLGDDAAMEGIAGDYPPAPGLQDAYATAHPADDAHDGTYHDFKGNIDGDRIDYILLTEGVKAVDCRIVREGFERAPYPTDHFPVVAHIRL